MKFAELFDKVFYGLSVSRMNQHLKGKSELRQYTDVNDWRFEVSFLLSIHYSDKSMQH